jgi:soluble lytic murein transglycosylase-like protein
VNKIITVPLLIICIIFSSGLFKKTLAYSTNIFSKHAIKERIIKQSINHGIDPALALSLVKQESNFNRSAKSHAGAIGLFQLMPSTAKHMGINPYYLNQNIKGGLCYFKKMHDKFGSYELALAAYNAGPGAVSRYGGVPPYNETRKYVKNIMNNYNNYKNNPDPLITKYKNNIAESKKKLAKESEKKEKPFFLIVLFSKIIEKLC